MIEDEIKQRLSKFSLPSKPGSFGSEYQFPEEISKVPSAELGNWMFRLAAWKGYALRMLSDLEVEKSVLKSTHDNKTSKRIVQESIDNRKVTKDYALGKLILEDDNFKKIRELLIIKEAEALGLNQIIEIYTMQLDTLSREISRRTLDAKLIQAGIVSSD